MCSVQSGYTTKVCFGWHMCVNVPATEMGQHLGEGRTPSSFKERSVRQQSEDGILPSLISQISEGWVMIYSELQVKTGLRDTFTILTSSLS